jgi:UDP-N-acetylmuramate: L-alanyl-gamma-D-glutamyl-meso-diaminopimelate ligase
MDAADIAFVYFNPHTLEHKKLETISAAQVQAAFGGKVKVYTDSEALIKELSAIKYEKTNLLLMTSGNFDGVDLKAFAKQLIPEK